jgi:hypothetical protein
MKYYDMTADGRRTIVLLVFAAFAIWAFALWNLRSTLGLSYHPLRFIESLRDGIAAGYGATQLIPALLMVVLIIATPLVIWNLCEEYAARYTPGPDGLRFDSIGITLDIPWAAVTGIRRIDGDSDDPSDELQLADDPSQQIRNPIIRVLHRQGYGRRVLPIYAGVRDRDELIGVIQRSTRIPVLTADGEERS